MRPEDIEFMKESLKEAKRAFEAGEVPVGAIIVNDRGEIIGRGHNQKERRKFPLLHAEIVAILNAHLNGNLMYLTGCTLYTTLEPCPMCTAALVNERVERIVFAAYDRRYGACGSVFDLANSIHLNHKIEVKGGILEEEASMLMKRFFEKLREDA